MWMAEGVWYKMPVKDYVYAETIQEIIHQFSDSSKTHQLIAGGAGISQQRKDGFLDCDVLVDISRVQDLKKIAKVDLDGQQYLQLGSGLSIYQAACDEKVKKEFPLLAKVLLESCDPARRNAYTLGGRLATKIPVGMMFPALCALNALVMVRKNGMDQKVLIVEWLKSEIFEEPFLITSVLIPIGSKIIYQLMDVKRRNYPGEIVVGVLVTCNDSANKQLDHVNIFGTVDKYGVVGFEKIADFLNGKNLTGELIAQAETLTDQQMKSSWGEDADALYRKRVLTALVTRSLNQLLLSVGKE